MKQWTLVISVLVVGLLVGGAFGYGAFSLSKNSSDLDKQIAILQNQNANLTSQNNNLTSRLGAVQNETASLHSNLANLSAQVANLTMTLNETRQALLIPIENFSFTQNSNGTYNFTLVSISNIGVLPKFLSVTVMPSEGVTIGPWVTRDPWLLPGDHFLIYGLISGMTYMVTFAYTPIPSAGTNNYLFTVPQGTFTVTNTTTGVYNITLSSISSNIKSPVREDILINGTLTVGSYTDEDSGGYGIVVSHFNCGDYLAPGDYFTVTGELPGTYTIELLYYGMTNTFGQMGYVVIASVTINIP